jgi:hypothetical protein
MIAAIRRPRGHPRSPARAPRGAPFAGGSSRGKRATSYRMAIATADVAHSILSKRGTTSSQGTSGPHAASILRSSATRREASRGSPAKPPSVSRAVCAERSRPPGRPRRASDAVRSAIRFFATDSRRPLILRADMVRTWPWPEEPDVGPVPLPSIPANPSWVLVRCGKLGGRLGIRFGSALPTGGLLPNHGQSRDALVIRSLARRRCQTPGRGSPPPRVATLRSGRAVSFPE